MSPVTAKKQSRRKRAAPKPAKRSTKGDTAAADKISADIVELQQLESKSKLEVTCLQRFENMGAATTPSLKNMPVPDDDSDDDRD